MMTFHSFPRGDPRGVDATKVPSPNLRLAESARRGARETHHGAATCALDSRNHLVEPAPVRDSGHLVEPAPVRDSTGATASWVCATGDSGGCDNHHDSSTWCEVAQRAAARTRRCSHTPRSKPNAQSSLSRCRARVCKPAPTCRSDALAGRMVCAHQRAHLDRPASREGAPEDPRVSAKAAGECNC